MNRSLLSTFFLVIAAGMGCAERQSSRFAKLRPQDSQALARRLAAERREAIAVDLRSAFGERGPRSVLALSGGGPDGAFGSGVLAGWRHAPGGRPTFDVVTGVSTGALMATFAFLGEERDDEALKCVYTHVQNQDIFDGPLSAGPPNSVFDTAPLRRLIARHVTNETIDRVAQAHRAGRRLYVATVSLDSGQTVVWPLSAIAASGSTNRVERFRQVLLAAAAVPVLFPPVEIDGELQVDAGLHESIFLRDAMLGGGMSTPLAARPDATPSEPGQVYAIVNGTLYHLPEAVPNNVASIGLRTITLLADAMLFTNLLEVAHVATGHPTPYKFSYISIPQATDRSSPIDLGRDGFDPAFMQRLFDAGEALGRAGSVAWYHGPPHADHDAPDATATAKGNEHQ